MLELMRCFFSTSYRLSTYSLLLSVPPTDHFFIDDHDFVTLKGATLLGGVTYPSLTRGANRTA
ncbi:hypothetical protein PENTCL1PPCAC_20957, partial [Pristionchus entomophagus]